MSNKKIQKVLDFHKPKAAGDVKKFVGLINYFHDHVPKHSLIMKPLHDMILGYVRKTRSKTVIWTEDFKRL